MTEEALITDLNMHKYPYKHPDTYAHKYRTLTLIFTYIHLKLKAI